MPTYEYYCEANGQTVEVMHSMSRELETWGEVCELAEIDAGNTKADSPVIRQLSAISSLMPKGGGDPRGGSGGGGGGGGCCGGGGGCGCSGH
jgi:predicted nucleic acid-binding Zn ribbon protein